MDLLIAEAGEAASLRGAGPGPAAAYRAVRGRSAALAAPLSPEDQTAQSMPDCSPTKWHLAHTTWFFETFVLRPLGEPPVDPRYGYLFNSYYEAVGDRQARPERGLLTRPSIVEVSAYRECVDQAMERRLEAGGLDAGALDLVRLGLAHEEQHQELMLTDILHLFSRNILQPAYRAPVDDAEPASAPQPMRMVAFGGGLAEIGWNGVGFAFDNEGPRHRVWLEPFRLADRLVTNGEWLEFIEAGGYRMANVWLSDGWSLAQAHGWDAPLYWRRRPDGGWGSFTLEGFRPLRTEAPVAHVSYYEADAFARWRGLRLPTEAEWEHAAAGLRVEGNFMGSGRLRPEAAPRNDPAGLRQVFGDVWEWTASPYAAYSGFRPAAGAVGEYNGKFMVNQMVLRGGSCATPEGHVRASYRNFFAPHQRWQFSGVRLAADLA